MFTLPEEFSKQISVFAPLFSKKVFEHVKVLLLGCLLTIGRRTVSSALRSVGLSSENRFHKYYRVLSLAKWSAYKASSILLQVLVDCFAPQGVLVFGLDETLERRWGSKIKARGIYRDAVRSSRSHFVKCSGLRWMCLMLLTPISWANRVWALPFLTVLAPSQRYNKQQGKTHKKITDWARQMILQLSRWLPQRQLVIVADASYACYRLLDAVRHKACMITPLRLDARLFDWPVEQSPSKRGPKPKIGQRQSTLLQRLDDPNSQWQEICIPQWYGQSNKRMLILTGTALWYKSNDPLVPLRWVLLKDPSGQLDPKALLSTDLSLSAIDIINFFIRRWTVEVTFEEVRTHLGVETQRQWSDLAIARTTPILMALFSIITLWVNQIQKLEPITIKPCAWYQKSHPTFSDAIATVRRRIWRKQNYLTSLENRDVYIFKQHWLNHLIFMATSAA